MSKKCLSVALVIFLFLGNLIFAGSSKSITSLNSFFSNFECRVWTSEDGLLGNTITDIIQDKTGYLYIGTYDGLLRFDGVDFVTFNRSYNEKYNFNSARVIFQDSRENIWVGSNDVGISCITPDLNVKTWTMNDGLSNDSIRAIAEDLEGNIWVGTASGVCYITPNDEIIKPKGLESFGDDDILVVQIYCDTAGRIWVTSQKANSTYIYAEGKFEKFDGIKSIKNPTITAIHQDYRGAFWFGVAPHNIVRINSGLETVYNADNGSLKGSIVNSITQDKAGNMWFALDSGLALLHDGKMEFFDASMGLPDNDINRILEDREGNFWLATDKGGLARLATSRFKTVPMDTGINAIVQDVQNGCMWLGGDDGLYCYDNLLNPIENDITRYVDNVRVRHLALTRDNGLLVSTYERFGQLLFEKNGKVKQWTKANGLTGDKTRVALEVKNGDLYIGTTSGLNIVKHDTGEIVKITRADGIPNEYVMCVFQSSDGTIWVGTDGGGVYTVEDYKVGRIYNTSYEKRGKLKFSSGEKLVGNVVFKICELKKDEIWFSTGNGISRLKNKEFASMNASNGLGTNSIFQILLDYTDKVWLLSNRGIACVKFPELQDLADKKIDRVNTQFFSRSDGLHSGGITSTALSAKDDLGRIWLTLVDGFAIYDPVKTVSGKQKPLVKIEKVTIDNEEQLYNGEPIVLKPENSRLIIKYTGLSFVASEQTLFKYKLSDFDKEESAWTNQRTVSYTNLKPGKYTFSVSARNNEEIESEFPDVLTIVKKPYFWQLWYFWVIVSILAAGFVAFIIAFRFIQMHKYQVLLEHEVERQTKQLHDKNIILENQAVELTQEKEKSDRLLLNILPKPVAGELSENPDKVIANQYDNVTVLFADIVGFTKMSSNMQATETVAMLNAIFTKFDLRAQNEGIEKIKTIGDCYMAACGLSNTDDAKECAKKMIDYAKGMLCDIASYNEEIGEKDRLQMRIGLNTGSLIAGVIGKTKFIYDIWGDTVNVASRMESTGVPGKIHVTPKTRDLVKKRFDFDGPEKIEVKGKGQMDTYFLKENIIDAIQGKIKDAMGKGRG